MECPDERVMLDLVAGRIPPGETAIRDHLDTCASCQDLVVALSSSVERGTPAGAATGRTIGRYVVRREIGRGAMATVYAAHDPELDREIALKLVHFRDGGSSAERLILEARAMAKLTHANVTRIYDVGTEGDAVFLAMELVDGTDLARWISGGRSWKDVVAVFAGAADGLAAAHAQRLVHRDFKPSNVLVGDDGRVLVTDFGLVHSPSEAERELQPEAHAVGPELLALTRTGTIVGTPAYMAPELLAGTSPADELSDQFSFAVSLFEGLYGVRPFAGTDLATLRDNVVAGRVVEARDRRDVPGRIHALVLRGLGPRERRFASMAELAAELRGTRRRRTRMLLAAAGITALLGGGVALAATRGGASPPADPCEDGANQIAAVYSPLRATELGLAFTGTGLAFAPDAWKATAAHLDRFTSEWSAGYRAACHATRSGLQSAELLDRRMACLAERKSELDTLVTLLARPDRSVVGRALQTAASLGRVGDCANTVALGTLAAPPASVDPAAIARVRGHIARLTILRNSANPANVIEQAEALHADATALGYGPVTAEAYVAVAIVHMVANQIDKAKAILDDAVVAAEAGRHFRAKAHALAVGMELAYNEGKLDDALAKNRLARAALAAIGGDAKLEADMESVLGWIADANKDAASAATHLRRALELRTNALGPTDLATARAHMNLAATLGNSGDMNAALPEMATGIAIERSQLGSKHPAIGQSLANLASVEAALGKLDDAIEHGKEALAIVDGSLPDTHPIAAFTAQQLGIVYHQAKRFDDAATYMRLAVARYEKALPPDHPDLGRALTNLAATLSEQGEHAELVDVARRALQIQEKALGASSPGTATIRNNLAAGLAGMKKHDDALEQFAIALAMREKAYGANDPRLVSTLVGIASVHAATKDWKQQQAALERALAISANASSPRDASLAARVQFELAKALRAHGGDKPRANTLANAALEYYRTHDRGPEVVEIQRWLEAR